MNYTITLNPAIDRLLFLDEKMESKKTNRITDVAYDIGGKGVHGSYAMSKLQVENVALGFMGELNAEKFRSILKKKGIKDGFIEIKGQLTRECYVVIEPDIHGTTMLTERGLYVSQQDVEDFMDHLKQTVTPEDSVLIAGSLPRGFSLEHLKELIQYLKGLGCFVACDLSDGALRVATDLGVNFIKPNEFEVKSLIVDQFDIIPFLKSLNEKIEYIVVSMGEEGSYCFHNGAVYRIITPKVQEVNDTGAGDCFVGAFLAGLKKGYDVKKTLRLASACAASKVTYNDSTTFNLKEVENLIHQVQIHEC